MLFPLFFARTLMACHKIHTFLIPLAELKEEITGIPFGLKNVPELCLRFSCRKTYNLYLGTLVKGILYQIVTEMPYFTSGDKGDIGGEGMIETLGFSSGYTA